MPKRNLIWLAVTLIVAGLAVSLGRLKPLAAPPAPPAGPFEPLIRLHKLTGEHYVDELPPGTLTGAIRGYLRALDPYCRYVLPEQPDYLDRLIHGRRCNLGIHYQIIEGQVTVLGVLPASPACAAGIQSGDVLLAAGDQSLLQADRATVDALLEEPAGPPVQLHIRRRHQLLAVELAPGEYDIETVTGLARNADGGWQYMLQERGDAEDHRAAANTDAAAPAGGIGYIRIREFATGTAEAFDVAVRQVLERRPAGLVLDLRDNPGGPLQEAVAVADRFLADGLIVLIRGRTAREERYVAHADRTVPAELPVVVLINGRTASAPELLAGALKRHRRALLVGTPTFGKNVVLRPFELGPEMGTVVLTTARYYFDELPAERPEGPAATAPAASGPATAAAPLPASRPGRRPAPSEPQCIAPHLLEVPGEAAERERAAFWYRMEALGPAAKAATGPATTRPATAISDWAAAEVDRIRQVDTQLARAIRLLRHPEAFEVFFEEEP